MAKIHVGDMMPDFEFDTAWKTACRFYAQTADQNSCLIFLRYQGCTICQLKIHELIRDHAMFDACKVKLYVVLQSAPETIRSEMEEYQLPFEIICDPQERLYHMLEIGSFDPDAPRSEHLQARIRQARAMGFVHGAYEGNELQLPAAFMMDREHRVLLSHYGMDGADLPEQEELLMCIR